MSLASPRLHSRSYPRHFTLITRTAPVLAPATLAALPSTRAIPVRDVFYVARPAPLHSSFFTSSFSLLTFPIVPGNKKAAEAFLRAAAFG